MDQLPTEIIAIIYDFHMNMNTGVCRHIYNSSAESNYGKLRNKINIMRHVNNEIKKIKYTITSENINTFTLPKDGFRTKCTEYHLTSIRKYNKIITYYSYRKQLSVSNGTIKGNFILDELRIWNKSNNKNYKHLGLREKLISWYQNIPKNKLIIANDKIIVTDVELSTNRHGRMLQILIKDDYIFPTLKDQ